MHTIQTDRLNRTKELLIQIHSLDKELTLILSSEMILNDVIPSSFATQLGSFLKGSHMTFAAVKVITIYLEITKNDSV